MKKIIIAIAVAFGIAVAPVATAEAAHAHHIKANVCAKQYKHWGSPKFRQCKRQGWFYERGAYPVTTETTPWTMAPYVLVWGPNGRLWVDTAGFYASGPIIR